MDGSAGLTTTGPDRLPDRTSSQEGAPSVERYSPSAPSAKTVRWFVGSTARTCRLLPAGAGGSDTSCQLCPPSSLRWRPPADPKNRAPLAGAIIQAGADTLSGNVSQDAPAALRVCVAISPAVSTAAAMNAV